MPFECSRCGECCANIGLVYTIKEGYGELQFLVNNHFTGEEILVSVDADKRDLFREKSILLQSPQICPFFRREAGTGNTFCTIHQTRPDICREYRCWRLLILNPRGRTVGKVRFIRSLCSEDPALIRLWDSVIEHHTEPDDQIWEDRMIRILTRSGYTVRR